MADHRPLHVQETSQDSKLSLDDKLEKAWENIYFRDDLSKPLDIKHSTSCGKKLKSWEHLAQEFDVSNLKREEIAESKQSSTSSTERLFEYLSSTKPEFLIQGLLKIFQDKEIYQVLRYVDDSIKEGKLTPEDRVSELPDKDPDLMTKIILKLDAGDLWKRVATGLEIPQRKCASFSRDPMVNPTRQFFTILRTQNPELKISTLKLYLTNLEQNEILEKMENIPETDILKDLPSEAALMCDIIEPKFNAMENNLLYKLAEMFQKDGFLKGVDIHDFRAWESQGSPTCAVIEYIITSQPVEYKIKDLVDRLLKIDRKDCVDIVKAYLKEPQEVEKMILDKNFRQLHLESAKGSSHQPTTARVTPYLHVPTSGQPGQPSTHNENVPGQEANFDDRDDSDIDLT